MATSAAQKVRDSLGPASALTPSKAPAAAAKPSEAKPAPRRPMEPPPVWMLIVETILKFIVAILVVILAIVLHDVFNDRDPLDRLQAFQSERFFTPEELLQYNGEDETKPILLGFRGNVYDVTKGARHYGPKGAYHFFAGRDATRAFVTGCFKEECLLPNIDDLTPEQLKSVDEWEQTYKRDYTYVGRIRK